MPRETIVRRYKMLYTLITGLDQQITSFIAVTMCILYIYFMTVVVTVCILYIYFVVVLQSWQSTLSYVTRFL